MQIHIWSKQWYLFLFFFLIIKLVSSLLREYIKLKDLRTNSNKDYKIAIQDLKADKKTSSSKLKKKKDKI